jgi:hypothetical protein
MKLYKVSKFTFEIEEIEAIRVSDKSYWANWKWAGAEKVFRHPISSQWDEVFSTRELAVAYCLDKLSGDVEKAVKALESFKRKQGL